MGLGPSVCGRCRVFSNYVPNVIPNKRGYWVCPVCDLETHDSLFEFTRDDQLVIEINTQIIRENRGQSVS
jgi:hypothetical protein